MNKKQTQLKESLVNAFKSWYKKMKNSQISSQQPIPPIQPPESNSLNTPTMYSKPKQPKQLTLPLRGSNKRQMSLPLDIPKKKDTYTNGTEFLKIAQALTKYNKTRASDEKKKKELEKLYRALKKQKRMGISNPNDINMEDEETLSELTSMLNEIVREELNNGNNPLERFAKENPDIIKQMREWAKDCQWGDIDELSDVEVLWGIQNGFDGGVTGFLQTTETPHIQTPTGFKEGVGYVHDKDMKKDPKHIPGERWRIKFQSDSDLKKHGNTEMSSVKEDISKQDLKHVIKELVSEMWDSKNDVNGDEVHDKLNEASDWNPQPLPKDERQVSEIIHGLKEGMGVFFSYDNQTGHSSDWIWIECVSNGDAYTYYMSVSGNRGKVELDDDSMIDDIAKEVSKGGYHFFAIQSIDGYKKPAYYPQHPEDDQEVGEYEKYGADQPEPQYENKSHVNEVLGDYDAMIKFVQSLPAEEINKITAISQKLNIGAYDAIIEYLKQVQLQKKKGGKSQKNESGLSDPFAVQQQITNFITPRNVAKHVISKPIKNSATGEWVVKWMTNGKRDENKTYYTDDEQDAKLTAKQMMKHASQMNATGK